MEISPRTLRPTDIQSTSVRMWVLVCGLTAENSGRGEEDQVYVSNKFDDKTTIFLLANMAFVE